MSDVLVVATLKKLATKIQRFDKQQFITNIFYKDSTLEVEFRNGFKQKFPITYNIDSDKLGLEKKIDKVLAKYKQLAAKYNKITENKELKKELKDSLLASNKEFEKKLKSYYQSLERVEKKIAEDLQSKLEEGISKIEVRDGKDGKDADNEAIIKSLQEFIFKNLPKAKDGKDGKDAVIDLESLKRELEDYIKANIPQIKDGKDGEVDYDKIEALIRDLFQDYKENSEEVLEKAINAIVVPVAKDGKDGRDADEEAILRILKEELQSILDKYLKEKNSAIIQALTDYEQKLEQSIPIIIEKEVAKIPRPKDGKDGIDGRDGQDADTDEILKTLNEKVISLANNTAGNLQEQVNIAVSELIRVGEKNRGKRGLKGDKGESIKGDKGDRGNGVKSAEIDQLGHLIIKTDDREINAGKVGIKNFYGGSAGGNPFYTNSKPIPFDVGQMKVGTRFKNADLRVVFTKLFYGFDFPEFDTFFVQNANNIDIGGVFEIGYLVPTDDYLFNFNIINPELLEENSIFIEQDGQLLADKLDNISPVTIPLNEFTKNTAGQVVFKILAYDTTGVTFQKDYVCEYRYKIYYGEYTDDIQDTGFVNPFVVLRATELVSDIKGEYHFLGIAYKWFCYPENLGENYIFYELTSDIAVIFDAVKKITVTNEYGLQVTYNCYRTVNEINEEFTMGVK